MTDHPRLPSPQGLAGNTTLDPAATGNTTVPQLVVLIGPAGAGKSTYAAARYQPHQVYSLDQLRAVVADDDCDQDATTDARAILAAILEARLSRRLVTVVDATNAGVADRAWLLALAGRHQVPATAVVFTTPLRVCLARQANRPGPAPGRRWGRAVQAAAVVEQHVRTQAALATLTAEGFTHVTEIDTHADVL
ncbi:Predicted kinase [Micromonospora citrea]|uniref:Predicted kinase n=1 Tax=Micromonospora citrea TaxID=47855 RepID=A0A1C6TPZ1_9ACTN|nr:AAA family ATPase [Micromonospora citrea]SCL43866.1 Predicted kinase [Micromonospora citrea]